MEWTSRDVCVVVCLFVCAGCYAPRNVSLADRSNPSDTAQTPPEESPEASAPDATVTDTPPDRPRDVLSDVVREAMNESGVDALDVSQEIGLDAAAEVSADGPTDGLVDRSNVETADIPFVTVPPGNLTPTGPRP